MRTVMAVVLAVVACVLAAGPGAASLKQEQEQQQSPWRTAKRAQVAAKLNRGLAGTPLRGLGRIIEQVGWRYHVHPAFMAAASGTESSFGAVPCCGSRYNIWGWYSMPPVASWEQAFTAYARFLRDRWPSAWTPWDFHGYCGCGVTAWGNATSRFMHRLGFAAVVRYPA